MIAATYGYVYVAQVAMGANMNQFLGCNAPAQGISPSPSHTPCINHGISACPVPDQEKLAVKQVTGICGAISLRIRPRQEPVVLDSMSLPATSRILNTEVRYTSLKQTFPGIADELFAKAEADAKERYETYKKMAEMK